MEYTLTAGTTYYYKVATSNYYWSDSNFGVRFGPEPKGTSYDNAYDLTATGLSYTSYESLVDGDHVWFKFVPAITTTYKFASSYTDLDYDVYTYSYGDPSSVYGSQGYYKLTAGTEYYIQCSYLYYVDAFDVYVETVSGTMFDDAIEFSNDEAYVSVIYGAHSNNVNAYDVYFKFTVEESGYYILSKDNSTTDWLYIYDEYNTSSNLAYANGTKIVYNFSADTVYYLNVTTSSSQSFTVSMEKATMGDSRDTAYEITEGENEAQEYESLVDGSYVWFKFVPESSGYYQFALTGASAEYEYGVYYNTYSYTESPTGVYYYLSGGSTYYIYYYDVNYDDSFGIKVEKARGDSQSNPIELEDGVLCATGYNSSIHSSSMMYFKFVPETSGTYKFAVSGLDYTHYLYLYTGSSSYYDAYSSGYISYYLTAGTNYYIRLYMDSTDSAFNMYVGSVVEGSTRDTAYDIVLGENEGQSYASFENEGSVWFKFAPDATGYYDFMTASGDLAYAMGDGEQTYTFTVTDYYGNAVSYYAGYGYYLSYGSTYYILCTADESYETNNFSVTVSSVTTGTSKDDAHELTLGEVLETGYISGINSSYTVWYKFVPESSGYYNIYFSNANGRYIYVYEGSNSSYSYSYSASSSYNYIQPYMYEGYTYYIMVDFYYSYSYDSDFDMLVTTVNHGYDEDDAIDLVTDFYIAAGYNSSYNSYGEVWFEFTPDTTAYYQFTVGEASRRYFYIYDSMSNYIYSLGSYTTSSSNSATVKLTAGETYYVLVDFYSSSYYDSGFYMYVQRMYYGISAEDAITLSSSSTYTGYNSSYNTGYEMWFKFTATEADQYELYLYNISEYYDIYVYDDVDATNLVASGTYLYGSGYVDVDCEADTTYYVKLHFTSYYVDTGFYIQVYQY